MLSEPAVPLPKEAAAAPIPNPPALQIAYERVRKPMRNPGGVDGTRAMQALSYCRVPGDGVICCKSKCGHMGQCVSKSCRLMDQVPAVMVRCTGDDVDRADDGGFSGISQWSSSR